MKPEQTKVMIPQAHKIITEITLGYLTITFPALDLKEICMGIVKTSNSYRLFKAQLKL